MVVAAPDDPNRFSPSFKEQEMCLAEQDLGGGGREGQMYTPADVATHNHKGDCWIVVDSVVYDVTPWLSRHPGGQEILLMYAGDDATDVFKAFHHPRECVPGPAITHHEQHRPVVTTYRTCNGAAAVPCALDDTAVAFPCSILPLACHSAIRWGPTGSHPRRSFCGALGA